MHAVESCYEHGGTSFVRLSGYQILNNDSVHAGRISYPCCKEEERSSYEIIWDVLVHNSKKMQYLFIENEPKRKLRRHSNRADAPTIDLRLDWVTNERRFLYVTARKIRCVKR
jgi:hypothetical protein